MNVDVIEESVTALADYARIPIRYAVDSVYDVEGDIHGGFVLTERTLNAPYVKD